jgi:hypothetical protein
MLEDRLVRLARGAARLNKVADEAAFEYKTQEALNASDPKNLAPDEVEVHMVYETALAGRLQLPWQTDQMLYRPRSGVTVEKVDASYARIIQGEQGDGLVNAMLDLNSDNFWADHLRKTYPELYELNDRTFEPMEGLLDELREAKAEWADPNGQANPHTLAAKMQKLADQLDIADEPGLFDEVPMSQQRYQELLNGIGYKRNELSRRLTREAMARAGL